MRSDTKSLEAVRPQPPKPWPYASDDNASYSNMQLSLPVLSELEGMYVHGAKCKS